jgi:Glyoxalase superfamily protein
MVYSYGRKSTAMIIMMPENKVKGAAKRMRKVLCDRGIELKHVQCLELAARLYGFSNWRHYLDRDPGAPFSPFDGDLSETDFAERDAFQMNVLEAAGLGEVARDLLDRVDPSGSWAKAAKPPVGPT